MGAALTLTRQDLIDGMLQVDKASEAGSYLGQFKVEFPDGINTASALEICRVITSSDMESKLRLMRICIQGRNVSVTCPNGDVEKFRMSNLDDAFEAFPLFQKEPLALMAISDAIYGHILKKSVRLPKAQAVTAEQM